MPRIHVCSLARLPETLASSGASHVLTLLGNRAKMERPAAIHPDRYEAVLVSDVVAAQEGHVLPAEEHVARILAFARAWDRERPLLIHCYAGVSRSTAAAYIAACALMPERDEGEMARVLRAASPTATPNRLFVEIGDGLLGRRGRMVAGIAAIGRGEDCFEGTPFHIPLD